MLKYLCIFSLMAFRVTIGLHNACGYCFLQIKCGLIAKNVLKIVSILEKLWNFGRLYGNPVNVSMCCVSYLCIMYV